MDADHVTAWSKGGASDIKNCELLCKSHNRAKGNSRGAPCGRPFVLVVVVACLNIVQGIGQAQGVALTRGRPLVPFRHKTEQVSRDLEGCYTVC